MSASGNSLQSAGAIVQQQAREVAFDPREILVWSCRVIAGCGGGFAFGWSVAGRLGALIGTILGLIGFALGEKYNR